jgi:chromosome partitioning protein
MKTKIAKKVSFASQKGGVGKSTLTTIIANQAHMDGLKVLVVDCDAQKSLKLRRDAEVDLGIELNQITAEEAETVLYKIIAIDPEMVPATVRKYESEYDLILIDVPGNLVQKDVDECYIMLDYLIVPFTDSQFDISSTVQFLELFEEGIQTERKEANNPIHCYGLLSKVNVKTKSFKDAESYSKSGDFPIQMLKTPFKYSERFKEASTFDSYSNKGRDGVDNIKELYEEILQVTNLNVLVETKA